MKLIIFKKHLGSLSSFLVLSLLQPSANAEDTNTAFPTSNPTPQIEEFLSKIPNNVKVLQSTFRSHGGLNMACTSETNHFALKTNISQLFDAYHQTLERLEEQYQDKIDDVLDTYESHLRTAQLTPHNEAQQSAAAKQNARKALATLKAQYKAKQQALKQNFHIS